MSHLDILIERARDYRREHGFSEEEKDRQVRSFAYGNTRIENDRITMVDIETAMRAQLAECERKPSRS